MCQQIRTGYQRPKVGIKQIYRFLYDATRREGETNGISAFLLPGIKLDGDHRTGGVFVSLKKCTASDNDG